MGGDVSGAARNICRLTDNRLPLMWRAECDCASPECGATLILEKEDGLDLTLSLYMDVDYAEYWCEGWWQRVWRRLRTAWGIVVHGRQEGLSGEFIFGDEEAIRDYLGAVEAGIREAT